MIELHYYPSTAAMVPHILLEEIGKPYRHVLVDRAVGAHKEPAYLKLNPNGLIPVLIDGGLVLYETAAICLHLCDTHPDAKLAPPLATTQRAHFYKWLMWLTNTLQSRLMIYFYPQRYVAAGNTDGAAEVKASAQQAIGGMLDQLDAQLARHGGLWFMGQDYTALDAYVFTMCRWTRNFSSGQARTRAHLGPYLERMLSRGAVRRAIASEKLAPPFV